VSMHVGNRFTDGTAAEFPEPMLLAIRIETERFVDGLIPTPIGRLKAGDPGRRNG
jgi:hypothetical protein